MNLQLTAWWDLDFSALRAELGKTFKRDIPVGQRDEREEWLAARKAEHHESTREIVRLETLLNARVYALFDLTAEEVAMVEETRSIGTRKLSDDGASGYRERSGSEAAVRAGALWHYRH